MKINLLIICALLIVVFGCQNIRNHEQAGGKKLEIDTIIFSTSRDKKIYVGERLFPRNGEEFGKILSNNELLALIKVSDTLFAFINGNMLNDNQNKNFPAISDSLLAHYYPAFYTVRFDDYLPFYIYLMSDNDLITLTRSDSIFTYEQIKIKDEVLSVFQEVRIGLTKDEVFHKLGFPQIDTVRDFILILCPASWPDKMWFNDYLQANLINNSSNIPILFQFKNNRLIYIFADHWLIYGNGFF